MMSNERNKDALMRRFMESRKAEATRNEALAIADFYRPEPIRARLAKWFRRILTSLKP